MSTSIFTNIPPYKSGGGGGSTGNFVFSGNQVGLPSDSSGTAPALTIQGANETTASANGGNIDLVPGSGGSGGKQGQVIIPNGYDPTGSSGYIPGLGFAGDNLTGINYRTTSSIYQMQFNIGGSQIMRLINQGPTTINPSQTQFQICTVASTLYPDNAITSNLGIFGTNPWNQAFINTYFVGSTGTGAYYRAIYLQGARNNGFGIGYNNSNSPSTALSNSEIYFAGLNNGTGDGNSYEYFHAWVTNNAIYYSPYNNNSASVAPFPLYISGGNNAAAGGGGDLFIGGGSSVGGNQGNLLLNTNGAALGTSDTTGFVYLPTCAGAPTGTPTSYTGLAPMVVDTTDSKLYVYISGSWKATTLT